MTLAPRSGTATRYRLVTDEKAAGVTYTPTNLAEFVARQIVETADFRQVSGCLRILDPAVGDGALLSSLLKHLNGRIALPIQVYGFDTKHDALVEARRRIASAFPNAELILEAGDFLDYVLDNSGTDLFRSLRSNATALSFDLVIANPPYVRTQILGARKAQDLAGAFGLSGRVDLYQAFLIGIGQVLRPGGTAGIIVSNRFMTTRAGAKIREALRSRISLRHIWDLGDTKLFGAAVLPAVILAEGRSGRKSPPEFTTIYETAHEGDMSEVAIDPIAALDREGVVAVAGGRHFLVRHGVLDTRGSRDAIWRIATNATDAWIATVVANSWGCFRDIGRVRVGVKTCADSVFIRSDWQAMPAAVRPELLRPLTTHHIARRFRAVTTGRPRAILYPHETDRDQRRAVDLEQYPLSRAYLESHRSTLENRSYVLEAGRRWYEIWVPQDPASWSEPKLVFRDISDKPTFWIDLEGTIVNGDCYWMIAARPGKEDLLWLACAVANSTFIEAFYDHRFNNKLYAGRRRFITQYVEKFPLPNPHSPHGREIISLARRVYSGVGATDTEALESDLNILVWRAFGLPIEEARR